MHERIEIEACYRAVGLRMAELPICNPALKVELVGWRLLEDIGQVGVLITPWCMNLLWQPLPGAALPRQGGPVLLMLPSGEYECIVHNDEILGLLASASLYSPMQDFPGQIEARAVAGEVLTLILGDTSHADEEAAGVSRRTLFRRVLGQTVRE
ncbi:[NiFe]-hydrogenase assembly chaperone HybE [Azomonas macrocytogenes]|uniref:[NiFe] hydrogenase assembly HybE family chaperone n=1 Tax=Azomonas macrocytogenes TaxID=69962 RepID=A0A839T6U6_AZOMA|nr:[NiFe]-hydrogenase assembly chaperone HybE [Azomonas macrocytogenes]MBB3104818.1 [NiFe] hydrogenase assembly HybE family chaperone [Azomonas macrocytogenes]